MIRALVLALTLVTGFAGLVYEVVWQRYVAILLGSDSESTAAVLGIFLGGLALGYGVFGTWTRRVVRRGEQRGAAPPLLSLYGGVEFLIGFDGAETVEKNELFWMRCMSLDNRRNGGSRIV